MMNGRKLFCFKEYTSFQSGGNITFLCNMFWNYGVLPSDIPSLESLAHSVTLSE